MLVPIAYGSYLVLVLAQRATLSLVWSQFLPISGQTPAWASPPGQTPPQADTPRADTPRQKPPWADTPHEMATAADGMHPTGIHSCFSNVFTGVCQSIHNWPHGYSVTAHPCYGTVGMHTIGMLSNWEFFPHKVKKIILREVRFNPCEDRLNIQNFWC